MGTSGGIKLTGVREWGYGAGKGSDMTAAK